MAKRLFQIILISMALGVAVGAVIHQGASAERAAEIAGYLKKRAEIQESIAYVFELFPALFKSAIDKRNLIMATGESAAHVNYLLGRGQLELLEQREGVDYYKRV